MRDPVTHDPLPQAARPLVAFAGLLRAHGFPVAPEQTMGFIEAVGLLGPESLRDVHAAALALLAPPHERRAEFDALFRNHFHGQTIAAAAPPSDDDDDIVVQDSRSGAMEAPDAAEINEVGGEATAAEALSVRAFAGMGEEEALRAFARTAPGRLPQRRSRRLTAGHAGRFWNLRRMLRQAVRHDGEVLEIPRQRRRSALRRIVLLIDVSGSMKAQTESALAFAHTLVRAAAGAGGAVEVFTFGTRLTRITPALRTRNREQALASAAALVADWDGGTRIGDALEAFLAVPRFAGFARGASVVVVSDGLERGEPDAMVRAVTRLSRLAWRIDWLTPLAGDAGFQPRTRALTAILPRLDALGDGSRTQSLCAHLLAMARAA